MGKKEGERQEEQMKFDWQWVWEWVTHPAPWIWSCGPILGCGDTCMCVCMWLCVRVCMHTSVHMVQSNSWSHQIFVVGLATVRVCWRKMKVVWRANHNIEARFKRRYLSSFSPALKSPLLHYHSLYHSSSIVASISFWQLISCVYIDYSLFMVRIGV